MNRQRACPGKPPKGGCSHDWLRHNLPGSKCFPAITAVGKGFDAYVATLMVEILKDNARPEAGEVYAAMDMGWATLVGQIAHAYGK